MVPTQLIQFKEWFKSYTSDFFRDDAFVNANLKLKDDHTSRVCSEMNYLTQKLGLTESQALLAETIALFHDLGRYEQFTEYRTFADIKSVPHGPLAVQVLQKHNVIDNLNENEIIIIKKAIALHSVKKLPPNLDEEALFFTRLIRDADKLDIFYMVTEEDNIAKDDCKEQVMINWFPKDNDYSMEMIQAVLNKEHIDYAIMKTNTDMKILHLAWVYDLNFLPTFEKVKTNKYLEKIIQMLPQTEDIAKAGKQVIAHVNAQTDEN